MSWTSSRFADFQGRSNRVVGGGRYIPGPVRMPDAESASASVSSSVNDMSRWLAMLLGRGMLGRRRVVDADALAPALLLQSPKGRYGYGFNVGTTAAGRAHYSHLGAFGLGAATTFSVVPAADLGFVALTNGYPIGVPETLRAQFLDLVEFGAIQRDWGPFIEAQLAPLNLPEGSLVGVAPPAKPRPPRALASYTGIYRKRRTRHHLEGELRG